MKASPTLFDTLYRASFRNEPNLGWSSNAAWRDALRRAKKFVLDDEMSTFMGELGTQAFVRPHMTPKARNKTIEHLRLGARLPSEITWIEYNLRNCQKRSQELLGNPLTDPTQTPEREGWLLVRHPKLDTAFLAHIVTHDQRVDHGDGFDTWTFPIAMAWTADMDTVLPWRSIPFTEHSSHPSEVSTGLTGYKTDRCGYVFSPMLNTPNNSQAMSMLSTRRVALTGSSISASAAMNRRAALSGWRRSCRALARSACSRR